MIITGAELLREVADAIEAAPNCYNQESWVQVGGDPDKDPLTGLGLLLDGACGTTACVAGWCVAVNSKDKKLRSLLVDMGDSDDLGRIAKKLLWPFLDEEEADELFQSDWRPQNSKSVPSALRKIARESLSMMSEPCIPCSEEAKQAATPPRKAEMDMPKPKDPTCPSMKPAGSGTPRQCEFDINHEGLHGTKSGWRWSDTTEADNKRLRAAMLKAAELLEIQAKDAALDLHFASLDLNAEAHTVLIHRLLGNEGDLASIAGHLRRAATEGEGNAPIQV